jgi:RNA polymerase sigma factor for flagellar operon FliA
LGLARAVARFDAARGVAFRTFAIGQIRGAVLDEIRVWSRIPRWAENLQEPTPQPPPEAGRGAGSSEANSEAGASSATHPLKRVSLLADVMAVCGPKSLDEDEDGEWPPPPPILGEPGNDPTSTLALSRIENAQLWACVDRLTAAEARVVRMHYRDGMTLAAVAEARGVTASREMQIHARAIKKLRRMISDSDSGMGLIGRMGPMGPCRR